MHLHRIFDHLGHLVSLGKELGKGGEGSVFEIAASPEWVGKVYHQPLPTEKQEKLRAITTTKRKELFDVAAWPTGTLHQAPGGPICGFLMRKIKNYRDVHFLYSPAHRKLTFPHADWRFLVHTAKNCAAAFDTLHTCGVVVGDVNQSNVFVSADAMVALVDCDSFQIAANGRTFFCDVGVDLFTPPELQSRSFRGVMRTPNHDNFGLAVLIFHLLFVGRHPFAGRFLGAGDMPIGQAISQHRFAFGRLANNYQMQSPPHAPTIEAVSPELANLFELAFGGGSTQSNGRPTAKQWARALGSFEASLRPCNSPGHFYAPHLRGCLWCELMAHGAPDFFVSVAFARAGGPQAVSAFVLSAVWARIEQVPRPNTTYVRPLQARSPRPAPWPSGISQILSPMPLPPAVLRSPPPVPAAIRAMEQAIPPKPSLPTILVSPPSPPTIEIGWPTVERGKLSRSREHITIGLSAVSAAAVSFLLLVLSGAFAVGGSGGTGRVMFLFSIGLMVLFVGFGAWWLALESVRKQREKDLDREYDAELLAIRAEADRKAELWKQKLAAMQHAARARHEQQVKTWENNVAPLTTEVRNRREAWERQLEFQQSEARRRYDKEVAEWKLATAASRAEAARRREFAVAAARQLERAEANWNTAAQKLANDFDSKKRGLATLRDRHAELGRKYVQERQELQSRAREIQLAQFLEQIFISDHKIPDIGRGRTATLTSYGIETADDVDEAAILNVPGFGPALTKRLMEWRQTVESQFVFNAAAGIPPQRQQALDSKYARDRQQLEMTLISDERELKAIAAAADSQLEQLLGQIRAAIVSVAQAAADSAAIPPGL